MSEDRYRCVCHTCETERLVVGLENAQAFFNEHAEQSHEVEFINRQTLQQYSNAPSDGESADDATDDA